MGSVWGASFTGVYGAGLGSEFWLSGMYVGAGLRVWSTIFGAERLPPSVIVRGLCAPSRVGLPCVRPVRVLVGSVWKTSLAGLCVAGLGGDLIYSGVVCLGWVWPLD